MGSPIKTPIPVKNSIYADWWKVPSWRQMHCSNAGNNLGVTIGGNGTGKSYLLGSVAEDLGWDHRGEQSLFNTDYLWEHVAFDTKGAAQIMKELIKLPKRKTVGYQIIIEEGQFALYSKDAFNDDVKDLSRLLMIMRSRRWGVYINLPSFKHLNKDVRMITNWLCWMKGKPTNYSFGTFYHVNTNMYDGEPYIQKPAFSDSVVSLDGLPVSVSSAYNILPFPKPSKKFIKPYEKLKQENQDMLFQKFAKKLEDRELQEQVDPKAEKEKELQEFAKMLLEDKGRFWDLKKNAFVPSKVCSVLAVGRDKAYQIIAKANGFLASGVSDDIISNNKSKYLGNIREMRH